MWRTSKPLDILDINANLRNGILTNSLVIIRSTKIRWAQIEKKMQNNFISILYLVAQNKRLRSYTFFMNLSKKI